MDRTLRGFPIGGLRKLFGIINAGLNQADFALCFDGGDIIKKELLPTYKAGRVPNYSVLAQIDLAKELLTDCDIPFYWDPRYEADDFIYSVCREFNKLGDNDMTVIFSDDRDLACCVTDDISIRNATSNGICINIDNFSDRVVKGREIPYNTILLWKIFHGDNSDNYKGIKIPGLSFDIYAKLYEENVTPLVKPDMFPQLAYADYDVFCTTVQMLKDLITEEHKTELLAHARIVFPYLVDVSNVGIEVYAQEFQSGRVLYDLERTHMKVFGNGSFNRTKFNFYCTLLGLNQTRSDRYVDKDSEQAQEFYNLLELRAKELASGTMAVERYRKKRHVQADGATLANMSLPI